MRTLVSTLLLVLLAACATAPDEHVPPFARLPYQAVSRGAIVAIALREWRLFGSPVADSESDDEDIGLLQRKPERQEGLWQRVGEYWWLGLDAGATEGRWTGKHDEHGNIFPADQDGNYPWSAAFVSYVMRIAGAGPRFPYAPDHAHYIDVAKRQAMGTESGWLVTAERPQDYAPRAGDLVCVGRDAAANLTYGDLPVGKYYPAHCDIVTDTSSPGQIAVVGGNDRDAVSMRHVAVAADGKLAAPNGQSVDPRHNWLTVLKLELPDMEPGRGPPIALK